jgi:class 3 adenylate cyclase
VVIELTVACVTGAALGATLRMARPAWRLREARRRRAATFVFADLVGYTALTERRGDYSGARVAAEFCRMMTRLCREHDARYVKSMGDGAMIWAPNAGQAVALAARTVEEAGARDDLLPVRVGAHTGLAVQRDGDWYGNAVNLAARLAREARPNEALVSESTQAAADADQRDALTLHGELELRGLASPVVVWRLEPATDTAQLSG